MTSTTAARKPSRVPGAKLLITASALAATLAGWASLARKSASDSVAAVPTMLSAEAQLAAAGVVLQPIPTLAPTPAQPLVTTNTASPQSDPRPVLRSVSAPPPPVTHTRSSKR